MFPPQQNQNRVCFQPNDDDVWWSTRYCNVNKSKTWIRTAVMKVFYSALASLSVTFPWTGSGCSSDEHRTRGRMKDKFSTETIEVCWADVVRYFFFFFYPEFLNTCVEIGGNLPGVWVVFSCYRVSEPLGASALTHFAAPVGAQVFARTPRPSQRDVTYVNIELRGMKCIKSSNENCGKMKYNKVGIQNSILNKSVWKFVWKLKHA